MTCQREGCLNPVKGPRSRFCSGACKQLDYRNRRNKPGVTTVTRKEFKVVTPFPNTRKIFEMKAPGPLPPDTQTTEVTKPLPPFVYGGPVPIKRKDIVPGKVIPLDRSHSPGCPCWTCKGVPSKQNRKP